MTTRLAAPVSARRFALLRLGLLIVALGAASVLVATTDIVDITGIRDAVAAAGPAAPLVFVFAAAVLGALLIPGPLLAGASGFLFGPAIGTAVTLCSAVGTAVLASRIGRLAGRDGAQALIGAERTAWLDDQISRRGLLAVAGQRLVPGMPDATMSYVFGALGVPVWQMALGAAIGSAPRAFVYTALGSVINEPSAPLAIAAAVVWCLMAVAGIEGVRRAVRAWRSRRR
jgi:uncharacterized membrane protein YdjX (TVP38/TMEM64 family)